MDPTTIIADRLASLDDARGHHHIACELLAALQEAGYEVVKVPTFAEISQKLAEEWSAPGQTVEWREWYGNGTPPTGPVYVRFRSGSEMAEVAERLEWQHGNFPGRSDGDIVAWRPA